MYSRISNIRDVTIIFYAKKDRPTHSYLSPTRLHTNILALSKFAKQMPFRTLEYFVFR